jgi:hypothetical protein
MGEPNDDLVVAYYVLKRGDDIVAVWDEGRWWTPYEGAQRMVEHERIYGRRSTCATTASQKTHRSSTEEQPHLSR